MYKKEFCGVMPAIFSVYDESGKVLTKTVEKMVNYQLENGMSGFYVGGNTGECTVLPARIRKEMLETVIDANQKRGKIIAHIGAGHQDETMDLLAHANAVGVDAVASLPPSITPYFSFEETIRYYRILAENSEAPVFAYITGVLNGDPVEFAKRVSDIPNIAGIKLTIPDYFAFGRVVTAAPEMSILNGPDETMLCGLCMGADGAIGTCYNFLPKLARGIYDDYLAGNMQGAKDKQHKLQSISPMLLEDGGISYFKAVLTTMGYDMGSVLAPSVFNSKEEIKDLENKLKAFGFYDWL